MERMTMSAKEAAEQIGVSMPVMYRIVHMEGFPVIQFGRSIRISTEGLKRWIAEHEGCKIEGVGT